MKRKLFVSLFIWICCLTLGMGSMDEPVSIKAPEPDKNFVARVVDQGDVSLELENVSFDGQTYLTGKMGKADLSIDFEKIRSMLFVESEGQVTAMVTLESHKQIKLVVAHDAACFGTSSFADVRISVRDIKKVVLHGIKQENE